MCERVVAGALLGALIGYERHRHGRPAGLRTHLLVALAAATFMIVSTQFPYYQHFGEHDGIDVDASRIAASVVSAVGFLAGGSILRSGATVQGLTTAAGLWLVTAIGLCAGAGMFFEAVEAAVLGLAALTIFRRFEDKAERFARTRVELTLVHARTGVSDSSAEQLLARVKDALKAEGAGVRELEYAAQLDEARPARLVLEVNLPPSLPFPYVVRILQTQAGVDHVSIQAA